MDDNERENQSVNVDANDNTDNDLLAQKTDHLLSLSPANCVPNGHYNRPRLSLGHASQQPLGRAVLEPIPLAKLSRSRRLSSEAVIQLTETCGKGNSEETPSSSDELLTKMFNKSCMEALNHLKKAYDQKLVSVVIIPISYRLISDTYNDRFKIKETERQYKWQVIFTGQGSHLPLSLLFFLLLRSRSKTGQRDRREEGGGGEERGLKKGNWERERTCSFSFRCLRLFPLPLLPQCLPVYAWLCMCVDHTFQLC